MKPSNVSLHRHETLRQGLLRTVEVLIESVAHSEDLRNDEQTLHRFRTTIKRLRALLCLIRPAVESAFFGCENERLRTAGRLLSATRDSEVARDTVKALPVSHQSTQEAMNAVLPGLEKRAERAKADEANVTEVKQRLEQTRRSFRQLKFRETDQEVIGAGIRKVSSQGRERMKIAIRTA